MTGTWPPDTVNAEPELTQSVGAAIHVLAEAVSWRSRNRTQRTPYSSIRSGSASSRTSRALGPVAAPTAIHQIAQHRLSSRLQLAVRT